MKSISPFRRILVSILTVVSVGVLICAMQFSLFDKNRKDLVSSSVFEHRSDKDKDDNNEINSTPAASSVETIVSQIWGEHSSVVGPSEFADLVASEPGSVIPAALAAASSSQTITRNEMDMIVKIIAEFLAKNETFLLANESSIISSVSGDFRFRFIEALLFELGRNMVMSPEFTLHDKNRARNALKIRKKYAKKA
ncbi:hypothetical protein, partial [Roseibacillus ishigakijimensis]